MFLCYDVLGCGQDLVLFQKRKLGKEAVQAQAHSDVAFVNFFKFHDVAKWFK